MGYHCHRVTYFLERLYHHHFEVHSLSRLIFRIEEYFSLEGTVYDTTERVRLLPMSMMRFLNLLRYNNNNNNNNKEN